MKQLWTILIAITLSLTACRSPNKDTVSQLCTIDALLSGVYDGSTPIGTLNQYGDFGLGTFDKLEGEMIVYEGVIYQIKADGHVYTPNPETMTTPFAAVVSFDPDHHHAFNTTHRLKQVKTVLDKKLHNLNIFHAIRIEGTFPYMKTRSVPAQQKPYSPLKEVAEHQSVFEMHNIKGTVIGFRCPAYVKGIGVPGYHLHFLSADRTRGGHILDFTMQSGTADIDSCHNFYLMLPETDDAFATADLNKDRSKELHAVEQ